MVSMNARQLMTPEPLTVPVDTPLRAAVELMEEHEVRHLAVTGADARLLGIVSDRELMKATGWLQPAVMEELEIPLRTVREVLQPMPFTVSPDDDLHVVTERMLRWGIGCTPVVEDGHLIGMITETDLLREFVEGRRQGTVTPEDDPRLSKKMTRVVHTIDPTDRVEAVASLLETEDYRHLPVTDGDHLLGILSDRDLRMVAGRGLPEETPVAEIIADEVFSLRPGDSLSDAAELMVSHKISAVPVAELGLLQGLVTSTDIVAHCARVL
jgi:CBS domain-containing protein